MKPKIRWSWFATSLLLPCVVAYADKAVEHIDAQPLSSALEVFADQSGMQVVYLADVVHGQYSNATQPGMNSDQALTQLLANTGLTYRHVNDRTVSIQGGGLSPEKLQPAPTRLMQSQPLSAAGGGTTRISDPSQRILEEVLVTGTRQTTDLQTTSVAISNISETQLEQSFARDLRGIADLVPNLVIQNVTPWHSAASIAIRGTGTGDIITTVDSPVGVVIDGFALPHVQSQLLDPFDLARVEVLRGPQGTLFGKNTTGGVMVLTSKRPEHNEFHGKIQAMFGSFARREYRGAVNLPLVEDTLSFRLMFSDQSDKGEFKNDKIHPFFGTAANPATPLGLPVNGDGRHMGGRDALYSKARLLWTPTANYEALITYEYLDDNSETKANVNETPANGTDSLGIPRGFLFNAIGFPGITQTCDDPGSKSCVYSTGLSFRGDGIDMEKGQRMNVNGVYLNQKLTLDQGEFELILGLREQSERLPSSFTGEQWPSLFDATRNLERDMRQAELRFTSTLEGPFQLALGAAYFENDVDFRSLGYNGFLELIGVAGANNRPGWGGARQDAQAYGVYGEFYYDISEQLRVTAGTRWSKEEKDFGRYGAFLTPAELQIWITSGGDDTLLDVVPEDRYTFEYSGNDSWDDVTFRFVLDWEINDNQFAYFSFNQGFRSGSFVETCASVATCDAPFDQEEADSYEIGYKVDLLDNTLRLNAAVFYTEFSNVVRSQVVPIVTQEGNPGQETQFRNIAGQESKGVELEATWLATEGLQLDLTLAWLDSDYTEFLTNVDGGSGIANDPSCLNIDAFGNDDAKCLGIDPNFTPEWQIGGGATYEWFLGNGSSLAFRTFVHWQPEYEYSVFNSDFTQPQERTLVDASIAYRSPEDRWKLVVFGKNLTDEVYRVAGNSVAGLWNFSAYGFRQRFGAELTVNF